jgi:dienelactone hydrolase
MSVIDPGGGEPRPAVVLVPGCTGPGGNVAYAAERMAGEGYVVLTLDYPAAYRSSGGCSQARTEEIAGDVVRAARRLRTLADVDPTRVHLVGWAEGGAGVMRMLADPAMARDVDARSAATLYPTCAALGGEWRVGVPFLMLLGETDQTAPAQNCISLAGNAAGAERVLAIRYGGAGHGFDLPQTASGDTRLREAALQDIRIFFGAPVAASPRPNAAR